MKRYFVTKGHAVVSGGLVLSEGAEFSVKAADDGSVRTMLAAGILREEDCSEARAADEAAGTAESEESEENAGENGGRKKRSRRQ